MSDIVESADKYYKSKKLLVLNHGREGRKRVKTFSYRQKQDDVAAMSSKYYANPASVQSVSNAKPRERLDARLIASKDTDRTMADIVSAFSESATDVTVTGSKSAIDALRTRVELAVGQNILTGEQADAVTLVVKAEPKPQDQSQAPVQAHAPIEETEVSEQDIAALYMSELESEVDEEPSDD